jgi:hypothetical protein
MNEKTRMTRQGLRDLNYYGPRRLATSSAAVAPKSVEDAPSVPVTPEVPEAAAEAPSEK